MRGISAVIEMILILLIVISLATLFWLFTSGTIKGLTEAGTQRTEKTREILSTCMIVDSIYENKVYIKNCGDGVIVNNSLNVFLDDKSLKFNMTPISIKKGEIGVIKIPEEKLFFYDIYVGDHDLKISNPSLQIVQKIESVFILPDYSDYLILDLKFDEGSGTNAYDSSVYGNNGILYSGSTVCNDGVCPRWADGKFRKALQFDGINDHVRINSIPQLGANPSSSRPGPTNGPVTITLWFKTSVVTPTETKYLFSDNYDEIAFRLLTSGRLQAETYSSVNSLRPINDDWHFTVLSYDFDKNLIYFYLDNEFQGSTSITGSVNGFNDPPFSVGVDYEGGSLQGPFNGIIDEVKIYKRTFTQDEMSKLNKISLKMK